MKKSNIQLTNPIPYKINMVIRGLNLSIKVENPNGLNHQKITINFKRTKTKEYSLENEKYELDKNEIEYIKYYLGAEGYLEEAKQHNIYFENEQ
jgi:hypothetical protein